MRIARQTRRTTGIAGIIAAVLLSGQNAPADPAGPTRCPEVSMQSVRLDSRVAVDEIRVIVARTSPDSGAATISVEAGRFGRVVHVMGSGSRGLKFTRPLKGHEFEVSLDPVFEAQRGACVEQILLMRAGRLVAAIKP